MIPSFERTVHIECPVQQAFNAWADATTFSRWFAPMAETEPEVDIDFRVGGSYEIRMALGPGHVHLTHGECREIERDRCAPDPASPQFEFNPLRCSSGSTLGSAPRKLR